MKLAILGALLSLCSSQEAEPQQEPLSVCEVLQRRAELMGRFETLQGEYKTEHNGRTVTVRGEVKFGPHGAYLIAAPTCTFKLTTGFASWPNVIFLEYPINSSSPFESTYAPFEVDWVSVRHARGEVERQGYHSASHQLLETFTGQLVSFDKLEAGTSPIGPIKRSGFGPAGLDAPAKLLIKSVSDVVVIRKPK
jgi:hypothetical protein